MKAFCFALIILSSCYADDVIYGEDHRLDLFEVRDPLLSEAARSTAAMMPNIFIHVTGQEAVLRGQTLQERGICVGERFSHQRTSSRCSGFLVAQNLLVTAGHCIRNDADCKINRWVFDYKIDSAEQVDVKILKANIFTCKKIVSRAFDKVTGEDFAVIELDRNVSDRKPLKFRTSGVVKIGDPLASIGYPSGLPVKIADGAQVRLVKPASFVANLDTFQGNSGSAVINTRSGEVEGILVRGEADYVDDLNQGCKTSKRCEDHLCRGEDVFMITKVSGLPVKK